MARRYYQTLGVPRDEHVSGIVNAFHDLSRHLYPERAGQHGTPQFRRTVNAYAVLGDKDARRDYDATEGPAEPLVPERVGSERVVPEVSGYRFSMMRDFEAPHAIRREVDASIRANFEESALPKSGRLEPLELNVALPAEEHGSVLHLGVPVYHPCASCHGAGHVFVQACGDCDGCGFCPAEEWIDVQPTATGLAEVSLVELGIRNFYLRVHLMT